MAACLGLKLELLEAWRAEGVTPSELSFCKNYLARSHVFDIDTAAKRVHHKVDAVVFDLPEGYHQHYVEHVKGITKEEADLAVKNRISTSDLTISVVGTHREIGKEIEASIPGLTSTTVVPFDLE
jgi:zinc protease